MADHKIFKNFFAGLWEIIEVLAIALIIVVIVRNYLVQPFLVSGASMYPTFSDGNYLLIDKLSYRFKDPERGDVPGGPCSLFDRRRREVAVPEWTVGNVGM